MEYKITVTVSSKPRRAPDHSAEYMAEVTREVLESVFEFDPFNSDSPFAVKDVTAEVSE